MINSNERSIHKSLKSPFFNLCLFLGVCFAGISNVHAAAYMKIGDIKGESLREGYVDAIEILSWNWGVDATSNGPGVRRSASAAACLPITAVKNVDKATPLLFLATLQGAVQRTADLEVIRDGPASSEPYLRIKLSDVIISSIFTGSASDTVPTEQVSLIFGKIEFEYRPQEADGRMGEAVRFGWDCESNQAL